MNGKHLLVLALLMVVAAPAARAGIYYEQEMKLPAGMGVPGVDVTRMKCYISGPKMRAETTMAGIESIVILRYDLRVMQTLMPAQKMCMEMKIPQVDPRTAAQIQVTVTKTSETQKIGQYTCTRYDVTQDGQTSRFWMSSQVSLGQELEMRVFLYAIARAHSAKMAQELAKLQGFPIRIESDTPQGTVTITVTTVRKQDIPDSMFEVPADYQKTTMPAPTGGGPGSKQ